MWPWDRIRSQSIFPEFTGAEIAYKYEGRAAQMRLKNRITRHESRSPSPKTAGPRVPAENLSNVSRVTSQAAYAGEAVDEREDVEIHREPNEEYLAVLGIRSALRRNRKNT